jgi:hypothetical protein
MAMIVGEIIFENMQAAREGERKLVEAGYMVQIAFDIRDECGGPYVWAEASKDIPLPPGDNGWAVSNEINALIGPLGDCDPCGAVGDDYVPFEAFGPRD